MKTTVLFAIAAIGMAPLSASAQTATAQTAGAPSAQAPPDAAETAHRYSLIPELEARLTRQQRQIDALSERVMTLDAKVAALNAHVEDESRYQTASAGLGLTMGKGGPAGVLTLSYQFLNASWYVGKGGALSLTPELKYRNIVTVRPLGLGVMGYFNPSDTLSARELHRSVDIIVPIGADVRVWEGLRVGFDLTWFLPNPVDVLNKAGKATQVHDDVVQTLATKRIADGCTLPYPNTQMLIDDFVRTGKYPDTIPAAVTQELPQDAPTALATPIPDACKVTTQDVTDAATTYATTTLQRGGDVIKSVYKHAWEQPQFMLWARWSF